MLILGNGKCLFIPKKKHFNIEMDQDDSIPDHDKAEFQSEENATDYIQG